MTMKSKPIISIFVSHRDIAECPSLVEVYNVIKEEVHKINSYGPQRHLIEIELQDYQIDRDLSNPNNGTFQSADTLKKDAAQAHAVFILVEGKDGKDANISERIEKWYHKNIRIVQVEEKENQVPIPIFWNISDDKSKENCEHFHKSDSCDKIIKYNSLEELRSNVADLLFELTGRWASRIHGRQSIPTLDSIIKKRRKKLFLFSVAIFFLLLCILLYFLYPKFQHLRPDHRTPEPSVEQVDSTKTIFNNRIINDSLMVDQNHSTPNNSVTSTTIQDSEPGSVQIPALKPEPTQEPKPITEPEPNLIVPSISPNSYMVDATPPSFQAEISEEIGKLSSFLLPCEEGGIQRWTFVIKEDSNIIEAPKKVDNDPSVVTVDFTVEIKDAKGELRIPQKHIPQSGKGKKVEDAIRAARLNAAHRIASFISDTIKQ